MSIMVKIPRWMLVGALAGLAVLLAVVAVSLGTGANRGVPPASPLLAAVSVGANPVAIALDSSTARAFVLNRGAMNSLDNPVGPGSVTVLDIRTGAVVGTTQVGVDPNAAAVDERSGRIFVANGGPYDASGRRSGPGSLSVLDASSGQVLQTIRVGIAPRAVALDDSSRYIVVVNSGVPPLPGSVTFLDAQGETIVQEVQVGVYPAALAVESRRSRAFVANFVSNTVSVLDLQTGQVVETIRLGPEPGTVAKLVVDELTPRLFALSFPPRVNRGPSPTNGQVQVVDTESLSVIQTVALPNPAGLALDARAGQVLVSSSVGRDGRLSALDVLTGEVVWTAPVGEGPGAIGVDEEVKSVFVLNPKSASATVLDAESGRLACTVQIGGQPVDIAIDRQTHRAVVVSRNPDNVSILRPRAELGSCWASTEGAELMR